MKVTKNILMSVRFITTATFRWLDSLCIFMHSGVDYTNEPNQIKQGGSWSG